MTEPRFKGGRKIYDPQLAIQQGEHLQRLMTVLNGVGENLEPGYTFAIPRTTGYRQMDRRTCFYASLIGIQGAMYPDSQPISEVEIAREAASRGLLGQYGAETFTEHQERQKDFIRERFGLETNFIDQRFDFDQVDALTSGLLDRGQPVIFGTRGHWIVLDGFYKSARGVSWVGMDPATGQRLEESDRMLPAITVLNLMKSSGQPVVAVDRTFEIQPRFSGHLFQPLGRQSLRFAQEKRRFRPASNT